MLTSISKKGIDFMRKFTKYIAGILFGTFIMGMTAFAAEYTVADVNTVLYTNAETELLADAGTDASVVLTKDVMPDGAPIQVTGITSNGYFRVELGGTYYIAGIGLQETPEAVTATDAPATTSVNSGSKYICVIEDGDKELFEKEVYKDWNNAPRSDYTNHELYIILRDEIETALAQGKTEFTTQKYGRQGMEYTYIMKNLIVDLIKAHPDYGFNYRTDCPTATMYNPYDGTQFAYHSVHYCHRSSFCRKCGWASDTFDVIPVCPDCGDATTY